MNAVIPCSPGVEAEGAGAVLSRFGVSKPASVPTPLIPGWHHEYELCALVMVYKAEFVLCKITQLSASFNLSVRLRLQLQDNDFRLGFAGTSFCTSLQAGLVLGNRQSCWLPKVVAWQGQPAAPCPCKKGWGRPLQQQEQAARPAFTPRVVRYQDGGRKRETCPGRHPPCRYHTAEFCLPRDEEKILGLQN